MGKRKFGPGDWATIKYGDKAGSYCKVTMLNKEGGYLVIPYGQDNEPGEMLTLNARTMDKIAPLELDAEEMHRLVSGRDNYDMYKDKVFPPFNIKASKKYKLTHSDIRDALLYIGGRGNVLSDFKEWFWLINNVFFDDLKIEGRYKEDFFTDCPISDDEMFSVAFGMVEKLYWRLEERFSQKEYVEKFVIKFADTFDWEQGHKRKPVEESGYKAVSDDIISRVNVYEYNCTRPRDRWIYSSTEKKHIVSLYENEKSLKDADPEAIEQYREFVEDLYNENEPLALKTLAWGHLEGNPAFEKDYVMAKKYLTEFFARTGDPAAANALGYVCLFGFANNNIPEYEEAFSHFTYASLAGIEEASFRAADMLIAGKGTIKNIDIGLNIIVDGYRDSMQAFCEGNHENMLAEFAMRMGNACRDDLIYGMNARDAYKFYLEAKLAIRMKREKGKHRGDEACENMIDYEMEQIRTRLNLDTEASFVKTDFPLYINQLFDTRYPIKVELNVPKGSKTGTMKVSRIEIGKEFADRGLKQEALELSRLFPVHPMMVAYPELSYAEMVTGINYILEGVVVAQVNPPGGTVFICDGFKKNDTTNALEFYGNGNLVAAVEAKWYVIEVDKNSKK